MSTKPRRATSSSSSKRRRQYRRLTVDDRPRGPSLLAILLSLLGLAVSLWVIFGYEPAPEETLEMAPAAARTEGAVPPRVASAPYRSEIRGLERALFEPDADDLDEASDDIAAAAEELQEALGRTGESRPMLDDALVRIVEATDQQTVGYQRLRGLQAAWVETRDRILEPAPWMRQPVADETTDGAALAAYSNAARTLADALDDLVAQQRNAEPVLPTGDATVSASEQSAWQAASARLKARLRSIERNLPDRPSSDATGEVLAAVQRLEAVRRDAQRAAESREPWPVDRLEGLVRRAEDAAGDFLGLTP